MKRNVARHYDFLVQPCSNITNCCSIYRVCNGISDLHSHKLQDCRFCTVAVLLPLQFVLKIISCKFNHYLNTVYYSKVFVLELIFSSVLPRYLLFSCAFVQPYLPWKSSKYYIYRYYVSILSYPTINAHAPYCHIGPLLQYNILPPYILIGRIFEGKLLTLFKCFDYFSQSLFETVLIQRELSEI